VRAVKALKGSADVLLTLIYIIYIAKKNNI